jgi:signal transduction histidine kinase
VAVLVAGHEAILDGVAEPTNDNIASLRDEALRIDAMADELSQLAAEEAAVRAMQLRPCDAAALCNEVADEFEVTLRSARITLSRDLKPVRVLADEQLLRRVVANLLSNAAKYTPRGGPMLLQTAATETTGIIRVADSGMGIAAEALPRIFDRFYRTRSAAPVSHGTGLGLAAVKEIVRSHHGEIAASSEQGRGTTMTISLPLA